MKVILLLDNVRASATERLQVQSKPLLRIGGKPIVWHVMKHYAYYGFKEFIISLDSAGDEIKRYFTRDYLLDFDLTINMGTGTVKTENEEWEGWKIHLVNAAQNIGTNGPLEKLIPLLKNETFIVTNAGVLTNIDLSALLAFHRKHGKLVTMVAVQSPPRFESVVVDDDNSIHFPENPHIGAEWISGEILVVEPQVLNYVQNNTMGFGTQLLKRLVSKNQVIGFKHDDFWQHIEDNPQVDLLEDLWQTNHAPWKSWL